MKSFGSCKDLDDFGCVMHVSVHFCEGVEGKGGGARACKKCQSIPGRSKTSHSKGQRHQRWKSLADMCLHCFGFLSQSFCMSNEYSW